MTSRTVKRIVFLALTAATVGMEIWFATDGDPASEPWTSLLVEFVPGPVTAVAIVVLLWWLPPHMLDAYRKRTAGPVHVPGEAAPVHYVPPSGTSNTHT